MSWNLSYSRIIAPKFVVNANVSYAGDDLDWRGFHDEDFMDGDVYSTELPNLLVYLREV